MITRRYVSAEHRTSAVPGEFVRCSAFVARVPPGPAKTPFVLRLTERGQAALATQVGGKAANGKEVIETLAKGGTAPPKADGIDRTEIERRVVLSVLKTDAVASPAARIDQLHLALRMDDATSALASFESWSRFETEYGAVDLGELSLGQTRSFEGKVSAGPYAKEKLPVSTELTYTATNEMNEDVKLQQRFVKLAGALEMHKALLYEEGVVGTDLVGTTAFDVTLRLVRDPDTHYVYRFGPLWGESGPTKASDVTFDAIPLVLPTRAQPGAALTAVLGGRYRVRLVDSGHDTIMEGDDRAQFVRGELAGLDPTPHTSVVQTRPCVSAGAGGVASHSAGPASLVVLFAAPDLARLRHRHVITDATQKKYVHLRGAPSEPLVFSDLADADAFLIWLRAVAATAPADQPIKVGLFELVYGAEGPVAVADVAGLTTLLEE